MELGGLGHTPVDPIAQFEGLRYKIGSFFKTVEKQLAPIQLKTGPSIDLGAASAKKLITFDDIFEDCCQKTRTLLESKDLVDGSSAIFQKAKAKSIVGDFQKKAEALPFFQSRGCP
jgi:hypothetical protein